MRIDGLEGNGSVDAGLVSGAWDSKRYDAEYLVETDTLRSFVGLVVACEFDDNSRRSGSLAELSPAQARKLADELYELAEAVEDAQ